MALYEIEKALFSASPEKAAGSDGLTIRVWREIWPVLQQLIHTLFSTSLRQGKLPLKWMVAKLVPLNKGNKDGYTLSRNYRPISLLVTLGKILARWLPKAKRRPTYSSYGVFSITQISGTAS